MKMNLGLPTSGEHLCGLLHRIGIVRDKQVILISQFTDITDLGWFAGLSGRFLAARTARLLVLAGTERLDKELMIGQMQGKFQLTVIPNVGHMVQEVCAGECCEFLGERLTRGISRMIRLILPRCLSSFGSVMSV